MYSDTERSAKARASRGSRSREIAAYIPGTYSTEPSDIFSGDKDYEKSAQCTYSNQKTFRTQGGQLAFLTVTTRMHKANTRQSGVDGAKAELRRKPGSAVGVPDADDDRLREVKSSRGNVNQAEISIRRHNVVISIVYHHDGLGEGKFTIDGAVHPGAVEVMNGSSHRSFGWLSHPLEAIEAMRYPAVLPPWITIEAAATQYLPCRDPK
ncbi:hypothetical protein AB0H00_14145 [Nocardia sp. NPDC023852]|uniref:hypothetical protein n=1 Tax=Nocardia sp. NPDC023852 TaxID=3154697 RepID=UPI0034071D0D